MKTTLKFILPSILLLLWCGGSAEAGEWDQSTDERSVYGYTHPLSEYNDKDPGNLRVTLSEDPCLATMEAAMRAMEPYIINGVSELEKDVRKAIETRELWRTVTQECWSMRPR